MLFSNERKLEVMAENLMDNGEALLDSAVRASEVSIMDFFGGINKETGALIGDAMSLYKDSKEFALTQARIMDKMIGDLEELKKMNEDLREQNEEMQCLLREISRKINKD